MEDVSDRVDAPLHLFGEKKKDWLCTKSINLKFPWSLGLPGDVLLEY